MDFETARLCFRELTVDDLELLERANSNPEVMRYQPNRGKGDVTSLGNPDE